MTPMKSFKGAWIVVGLLVLVATHFASAATIQIHNVDPAGKGFNDPTPATPVGGNPGTTVGQQALNVFQAAADIWAATIQSNVVIRIKASFSPSLTCNATGAILAQTAVTREYKDPSFPNPNIYYPKALADAFSGQDLDPTIDDMTMTFNSNLGLPSCAFSWDFGLDHKHADRGAGLDMLATTSHEVAHGLGFSTGILGLVQPAPVDAYSTFLFDGDLQLHWPDMTSAQRNASSINPRKLWWDGPNSFVNADTPNWAAYGIAIMNVQSPNSAAGTYSLGEATFGPRLTDPGITGTLQLVSADSNGKHEACEGPLNPLAGAIAVVDRGTCPFVLKAKNVQDADGIAMIVADNQPGDPPSAMSGDDPTVTIPSVRVTQTAGATIKTALQAGTVTAQLRLDMSQLAGAEYSGGRHIMFSPNPFQGGSSVSHWDTSSYPHLLLEPSITPMLGLPDPHKLLDLTTNLMRDIGWTLTTNPKVSITAPDSVIAGTNITYTITVLNDGFADAEGVTLDNPTPPSGLQFVSNTGDCTAFPCAFGTLLPGSARVVNSTYSAASSYSASGPVQNTATVTSTTVDTNPNDNTATISTSVSSSADLSVTISGPALAVDGTDVSYTIQVTNAGPSDAANVSLSASPGGPLTFGSNAGACTSAFPCNLGNLAAGASVTITSTFTLAATFDGSSFTTGVTVTSDTADPNSANNSASANTVVSSSGADLAVRLLGPSAGAKGSVLVYTVQVTNAGPSDAAAVSLTATVPSGLTFVSNSGDCATAFPCNLGNLTAGTTKTITSKFNVSAGFSGSSVTSQVTVSSSTADPNMANNTSTATTNLSAAAAPTIASLNPNFGPIAGGTQVTITGTNFANGSGLGAKFGGVSATSVSFVNATTLYATTPSQGSGGVVDVEVANPDGQTAHLASAFTYQDVNNLKQSSSGGCSSGPTGADPTMLGAIAAMLWLARRRRTRTST